MCQQDAAWQLHCPACRTESNNGRRFVKCSHPTEYESCLRFAWADEFDAGPHALPAASDMPVLMHPNLCSCTTMQPAGQPKSALCQGEQCRVVEVLCGSTTGAGLQVLAGSRPHEALKGPAGVAMCSPPGDAAERIMAAPIAWWQLQVQPDVAAGPVFVF